MKNLHKVAQTIPIASKFMIFIKSSSKIIHFYLPTAKRKFQTFLRNRCCVRHGRGQRCQELRICLRPQRHLSIRAHYFRQHPFCGGIPRHCFCLPRVQRGRSMESAFNVNRTHAQSCVPLCAKIERGRDKLRSHQRI